MVAIHNIPAEITLLCFHYYVGSRRSILNDTDAVKRRRRTLQLTHICRKWRVCALGDPSLWTDVHIFGRAPIYLLFLERSRPLPIDLTVVALRENYPVGTIQHFPVNQLGQFKEDMRRIRTINLWALTHESCTSTLRALVWHRDFPALDMLGVHSSNIKYIGNWRGSTDYYDTHNPATLNAPLLKSVVWTGQCIPCVPQAQFLTSLELHRVSLLFNGQMLRDIFSASPMLSTLVIGRLSRDQKDFTYRLPTDRPVHAPSLKTLAIASPIFHYTSDAYTSGNCLHGCLCAIRNLVAKNLEYLEVTGQSTDALAHIVPIIRQRTEQFSSPLTLLLNSLRAASFKNAASQMPDELYDLAWTIDLQLYPEAPWSIDEMRTNSLMYGFRSVVVHFPETHLHLLSTNASDLDLLESPVHDRIPVLVSPILVDLQKQALPTFTFRYPYLDAETMEEKFGDGDEEKFVEEQEYDDEEYYPIDEDESEGMGRTSLLLEEWLRGKEDVEEELVDSWGIHRFMDD